VSAKPNGNVILTAAVVTQHMLRLTPHDRGLAVEKCGKPGACVPAVALRTWIWIVNIMLPGEMLKDVVPSDSGNDVTPPPLLNKKMRVFS